jgi:putative membrane protein
MSEADFFSPDSKQRAAQAVRAVEAQTSAEVVVAVRRRSGDYGVAAYHFGLLLLAIVVVYMLVAPQLFTVGAMALDGLLAFLVGLVACRAIRGLTRLLTPKRTLSANVQTAARAAFYDLGIGRTQGRNGILVFISTFERRHTVLPDVGVDPQKLEPTWSRAGEQMAAALMAHEPERFFTALETLGPALGAVMPRAADDVNELPDEVQ